MYAKVIVRTKARFADRPFTYVIPEGMDEVLPGMRVAVPFGKTDQPAVAIVLELTEEEPDGDYQIKEILDSWDTVPILSEGQLELAMYMVDRYLCDPASALQVLLPPANTERIREYYRISETSSLFESRETRPLAEFLKTEKSSTQIEKKFRSQITKTMLKQWTDSGDLIRSYQIDEVGKPKGILWVRRLKKEEYPRKNATRRIQILEYLKEHGETKISEVLAETSASSATIRELEKLGWVEIWEQEPEKEEERPSLTRHPGIELNEEQQAVFRAISRGRAGQYLIHGVTGSGKTEIYLDLAEETLDEGKDVIILVPEISLTPQTIARFSRRFGNAIAVYHSNLTNKERLRQWNRIRSGEVKIVVGARSAIFSPFSNLGLIVIDEEHELSYASEQNPKYRAAEIAEFRASRAGAKLVLGSATPDIETYAKTKSGQITLLEMKHRVKKIQMPEISVVDMREELKAENYSVFSRELHEEVTRALAEKSQILLFLNKRGHTSYVFCRRCGYIHKCDACDVAMTYHKAKNHLICHYCGRTGRKPVICPSCGSHAIKEFGAGTEKLEEETRVLFPEAKVVRMDADTTVDRKAYDRIYGQMMRREIDILIGTQMIAKGLDFPGVTLVGVVAADLSLNIPDYRATERTFQLLMQVSGRAGRSESGGKVVIQSYVPEHPTILAAANGDYAGFFRDEMDSRQIHGFPPFRELFLLRLFHTNSVECRKGMSGIARRLIEEIGRRKMKGAEVHGPYAAAIERVNNKYRYQVLVKVTEHADIMAALIQDIVNDFYKKTRGYSLSVTRNPVSLN